MCAIFGLIGECNKNLLQEMSKVQRYRGPDNTGFYFNKNLKISLGMNRLAVIDKKKGTQPMYSWDNKIIGVFNGTIFNFIEIKNYLIKKNVEFKTNCDTEVLINSFSFWGEKCFNYFDGMWAAALYNFKENTLYLSRDYLGQKPLFYSKLNNKNFIFSSQINGILKSKNKFDLSKDNIKLYHQFSYTPSPYTVFQNIFQIKPGEIIKINKKIKKKIFWDLRDGPDYNFFFKKNNITDIKENFNTIIKNYIISDKNSMVALSSGIDSNLVWHSANKLSKKIKSITIGFDEKSYDETKDMDSNKKLQSFKYLTNKKILKIFNNIKKKIIFFNGDGSFLPTYFLFNEIKKKTNVALSGDGGDEVFFGYITFKAFWVAKLLKKIIPQFLIKLAGKIISKVKYSSNYIDFKKKIILFFKYLDKDLSCINIFWLNDFNEKDLYELTNIKNNHKIIKEIKSIYNSEKNKMRFCQIYYFKYYLPMVLEKVDNASMLNSVESRAPLLNKNLINFTLVTDPKENFNLTKNKKILVDIFSHVVPDKIKKNKKHGFSLPKHIILKNKKIVKSLIKEKFLINTHFFHEKYEIYLKENKYENYIWNEMMLNLSLQNLNAK
jgi:asparagine synthase (glutamine-hydrolysing)